MWHKVLSCINTADWLVAILKLGTTCFFNICLYTVALILPRSLTRGPVPTTEIMPNTITLPPPNLTLFLVHRGECHSLGLHRTNLLPSQPNRLNFDSSLKWTQSHWSCDVFSGKFQSAHFVLLKNIRLRRSYSTIHYFITSSGNSVPWYCNAKFSISS